MLPCYILCLYTILILVGEETLQHATLSLPFSSLFCSIETALVFCCLICFLPLCGYDGESTLIVANAAQIL